MVSITSILKIGRLLTTNDAMGDRAVLRCGSPHPKPVHPGSIQLLPDAIQAAKQERVLALPDADEGLGRGILQNARIIWGFQQAVDENQS